MNHEKDGVDFEHVLHDGVKELQAIRLSLHDEAAEADQDAHGTFLLEDCSSFLAGIVAEIAREDRSPKAVLARTLHALGRTEAKHFVLQNLLEQLKRGERTEDALRRFAALGLAESPPSSGTTVLAEPATAAAPDAANPAAAASVAEGGAEAPDQSPAARPAPVEPGRGGILQCVLGALKRAAYTLGGIAVNAAKHIPALLKLKPKPIIGITGAFPSLSFQFDIEMDGISIQELFRVLSGAS
jgi:hypothetical protein